MESAAVNAPDSFCFYVMINIENISISFGNLTLFRGLDLQVHYGESVCICGGSGSGKSSLLKAVLGFVPLSEGTIRVQGLWKRPGVWNVEEFDPDPFMEQLNKQGLPWHEVFDGDLEL